MANSLDEMLERMRANRSAQSAEPRQYECAKCQDSGWVTYVDEKGIRYAERCGCFALKEARRHMEQSGISKEFTQKGFKEFETFGKPQLEEALDKAVRYYQAFKRAENTRHNSILLYGQPGAGKTHLGTAICNNLMGIGVAVVYMPYRNAVTRIKQLLTDEAAYGQEISRYMNARVLYIDDFLKGRITESDVNIMYEIVNHRYMNRLPMIISTEKGIRELMEFDEAIASRIIEMSKGNVVRFQGGDLNYRLNHQKAAD